MSGDTILAIDPGTEQSGWCEYSGKRVLASGVMPNIAMLEYVKQATCRLAIEMIESMGMAVGQSTFETVRWIGRFQQAYFAPELVLLITRRNVKLHLCGSMQAKDPNVRQALIDKIGEKGTKTNPGPTYGISSHAWSALAIAVTAAETRGSPVQ